jgi:predicted RNA-binding protein with PIN domain
MSLLIDGYNVLYAVGLLGIGIGPGDLQRARLALLNFLAESLKATEIPRTTVVFDAREAPWGLPRAIKHRGIQVRFATQHESADELIEELIRAESSPRRLTVVSSDHRIQRAAHRRKARMVDSDVWYAELLRSRQQRRRASAVSPARPPVPLLAEDVNYWVRQFGGESALAAFLDQELEKQTPPAETADDGVQLSPSDEEENEGENGSHSGCDAAARPPALQPRKPGRTSKSTRTKSASQAKKEARSPRASRKRSRRMEPPADKPRPAGLGDLDNPFPPGYGEDLLRDL